MTGCLWRRLSRLGGFVGLYLALLVPIIVGFVHIGWEKCGHGLTSRPRESASEPVLDELLGLSRCPPKSGRALLTGTFPLRYCAARFACRAPTWRLPVSGHVACQIAIHCEDAGGRGMRYLVPFLITLGGFPGNCAGPRHQDCTPFKN